MSEVYVGQIPLNHACVQAILLSIATFLMFMLYRIAKKRIDEDSYFLLFLKVVTFVLFSLTGALVVCDIVTLAYYLADLIVN